MTSQSTNALLFGIAVIAFGGCLELSGRSGGLVVADAGILFAVTAFLSGYASDYLASGIPDTEAADGERA